MTQRNDKGQFSSPTDKQISQEMAELLGLYLTSLKEQKTGTSESTVETREREVRYWLAYCENNGLDPLSAKTSDVRGYIQSITDNADTTVGSYYSSVQSFYTTVKNDQGHERLELENDHPCRDKQDIDLKNDYRIHSGTAKYQKLHNLSPEDVEGVREKSDTILALKPEKVEKLFENVPGEKPNTQLRNEIATRLNWYTGCRSVELERLDIDNIDWDNCRINVRSAKLNPEENPDLIRRDVYFPEDFKFQLRRWCMRVRHTFSSHAEPKTGKILVTTQNAQMDGSTINDVVKEAARNAGIQQPLRPVNPGPNETVEEWFVTTHRIRRSAISHWVNDCEEIDLHQSKRLAGHAQIERTMDYIEDDDKQLADDYHKAMG